MDLSFSFSPTDPHSIISGEIFTLIITLNWLVNDPAPPLNQRLQIALAAQQPMPNGSTTFFNPPGPAPVLVWPQQGSFVAATATTPGQQRYLVGIEAGNVGRVQFNVSLVSPLSATYDLVIA